MITAGVSLAVIICRCIAEKPLALECDAVLDESFFAHSHSRSPQEYCMYSKDEACGCGEKDPAKTVSIPM